MANRVRNALLAENNQLMNAVEVMLSPSRSYQIYIRSHDICINGSQEGCSSESKSS